MSNAVYVLLGKMLTERIAVLTNVGGSRVALEHGVHRALDDVHWVVVAVRVFLIVNVEELFARQFDAT